MSATPPPLAIITPSDTSPGEIESRAELDRHVGQYELRPGVTIAVRVTDGDLTLVMPRQSPLTLRSVSEDTFECGALKTRVAFGGDGAERTLTVRQAGEELVARRVGP